MEKKLCYFFGDYNINLFNYGSHNLASQFIDMMYSFSYVPLINRPTRITKNSASLIDNIFTNNYNVLDKSMQAILITDISDHLPIIHINWKYSERNQELSIVKRCYSAKKKVEFKEALIKLTGLLYLLWMIHKQLFRIYIINQEIFRINTFRKGEYN